MKTQERSRFIGLARRILETNKAAPKYSIQALRHPYSLQSKEAKLASYLRYSVNIERRL